MKISEVKKNIKFYPDSPIVFFPNGFPRMSKPKGSPHAESNDQPQNIGYAARSNVSEPIQNTSISMKEYRQLHRRVQHRMQTYHLQALIPSSRPSMKRSMTRSSCPRWKRPEAPLPLHIKTTIGRLPMKSTFATTILLRQLPKQLLNTQTRPEVI